MLCFVWIRLSRNKAYNLLSFIQQNLMLFENRISECKLGCTLIDELTGSIVEPESNQECIATVEEVNLPDNTSNLLACQLTTRLNF